MLFKVTIRTSRNEINFKLIGSLIIEIGSPWRGDDGTISHGTFLYHLSGSKKRKLGKIKTYDVIYDSEFTAVNITITDGKTPNQFKRLKN